MTAEPISLHGQPQGKGREAAESQPTPAHYLILWAIMEDERVSAAAKCIATVLLLKFRNHKTGLCNPSFNTIAGCVGRKRRSVIDAINELKELGWMDWDGTAGGSPTNTNNFQFYLKPQPVQSAAPVQFTTPVQSNAPTGAVERTQPVQSTAHELSIELSKNHKPCRVAKATPTKKEYSKEFEEAWQAYPMRLGGTPKPPAAKLFLAAVKAGTDPKMIIDAAGRFAIAEQRNVGTPFIPQMVKWMRDRRWLDYGPGTSATIINIRGSFI
jgi:Helix-turn-helix domain